MAASAMAVIVGVLCIVFAFAGLGMLVNFASRAVLLGFTGGAGVLIAAGQLKNLLRLDIPRSPHLPSALANVISEISQTHVPSLALGLGKTIVDGGRCWSYSPAHPQAPPPFGSVGELLDGSQTSFWAVNMGTPPPPDPMQETEFLVQANLGRAADDGALDLGAVDRLVEFYLERGVHGLTILGIILFLRLGYVVGNAGLGRALMIVALANGISVLTTFSLSAIATNLKVKGGGDYYLISRTLGVEFGGALGIVLFAAQTISIAFYAIGFGEAVATIAGTSETALLNAARFRDCRGSDIRVAMATHSRTSKASATITGVTSGPMSVPSSIPSPTASSAVRLTSAATNSS